MTPRVASPVPSAVVLLLVTLVMMLAIAPSTSGAAAVLRKGDRGELVFELQEYLALCERYTGDVDGVFGEATHKAVVEFQKSASLTPDGIVGDRTWQALSDASAVKTVTYVVVAGDTMYDIARRHGCTVDDIAKASGVARPEAIQPGQKLIIPAGGAVGSRSAPARGGAELLNWSEASLVFTRYATVIDCKTGISFQVQRRGGSKHADAEPLTAADAAAMKKAYGGTWSWDRRAVVVVVGSRRIAASINGMPHGGQAVSGNGFDGHFCVHFLNSKTHGGNSVDAAHQRMVQAASNM